MSFDAPTLIAAKRDGAKLPDRAIEWLVQAFVRGEVADYQMSAFAMAVVLRGMDATETRALTLAMRDSGRTARIPRRGGPKVDKHSTGGVGDKVSIALAPLAAACGLRVPMISGRGLGHTGGTLDKLEAIPGFRVDLTLKRFQQLVSRNGLAMAGQTADLAPADRKLYALRDVTATVESVPLITASILSKKLAEDLDALVMDVKVGTGAFMKTVDDARTLARSIVKVGNAAGVKTRAVLTCMNTPLGNAVGNALETAEAFALLQGQAPDDLMECTQALACEMLLAAGLCRTPSAARSRVRQALVSGSAAQKARTMVAAQGGDPRVVDEPDRLPQAPHRSVVKASRSGFVTQLDALRVGRLCVRLGAGRVRADQDVDARVGIVLHRKPGDPVRQGQALATLHLAQRTSARGARSALAEAFVLGTKAPRPSPLVLERLRR